MLKSLFNLLYPETCVGCNGILLQAESALCTGCRHNLPLTLHHLDPANEAVRKLYGRLDVAHASAMVYFHKEGIVQEIIHNLKYRGRREIGALMGGWYAADLKDVPVLQSVTDVVPVPLHKKRLRERGYNQAEGFARAIARGLGAAYSDTLLQRTVHTRTQTKKTLQGRAAITRETFTVSLPAAQKVRHFLLVDDVMTTGATIEACGKALLEIPGARLSIVTLAYTQ